MARNKEVENWKKEAEENLDSLLDAIDDIKDSHPQIARHYVHNIMALHRTIIQEIKSQGVIS